MKWMLWLLSCYYISCLLSSCGGGSDGQGSVCAIGMDIFVDIQLLIMTSSNGNFFRVTGHLCGEFTGPSEFPAQWSVTRSFDVFFDLRLNKPLSKQWWGWRFEPSRQLWRHCNVRNVLGPCGQRHGVQFAWSAPSWSWTLRENSWASWHGLLYMIVLNRCSRSPCSHMA